jgi:hypothetical protein
MTTWNYRILHEPNGTLTIREVTYDMDGHILTCSRDSVALQAESIDQLLHLLEDVREALRLPILMNTDLPSGENPPPVGEQVSISHAELIASLGLHPTPARRRTTKRKAS